MRFARVPDTAQVFFEERAKQYRAMFERAEVSAAPPSARMGLLRWERAKRYRAMFVARQGT